MSVVNVFVSSRQAYMLTDTTLYRADGTIIGFQSKAVPVDSWTGVISATGNLWGLELTSGLAENYQSFDEFIARSAPIIEREYREEMENSAGQVMLSGQAFFRLVVAGWSEREDRAKCYILDTPGPLHDGPTYRWIDREEEEDGILHNDLCAREAWLLHRQGAEPGTDFTAETFDPVRHGIPLVEAQRRQPVDPNSGLAPGSHVIGGTLELTTVTRDGVTQEALREWPDEAYVPIRPEAISEARLPLRAPSFVEEHGTPEQIRGWLNLWKRNGIDPETLLPRQAVKPGEIEAPASTEGMTRQQRRALKARERKVARVT